MLLYPSVDLLRTKVDSKYTLAVMAAKRARDLIDGKPMLELTDEIKPLTIATDEIADDLISYKRSASSEAAEDAEAPLEDYKEAGEEAGEETAEEGGEASAEAAEGEEPEAEPEEQ